MIDPKNVVNLTCGLVADPEVINGKIAKFRVAVDFASQDKTTDNKSGYFDVTYYATDGSSNSTFVFNQIEKGNFKKGSQLQVVGRLVQERWEKDGQKGQRVVVVAEAMTYAGGGAPAAAGAKPASSSDDSTSAPSLPTSF